MRRPVVIVGAASGIGIRPYDDGGMRQATDAKARPTARARSGVSSLSTMPRTSYSRKMAFGVFTGQGPATGIRVFTSERTLSTATSMA